MIMDLCALYAHDNADLTQRLVAQLFEMQPGWVERPHLLTCKLGRMCCCWGCVTHACTKLVPVWL